MCSPSWPAVPCQKSPLLDSIMRHYSKTLPNSGGLGSTSYIVYMRWSRRLCHWVVLVRLVDNNSFPDSDLYSLSKPRKRKPNHAHESPIAVHCENDSAPAWSTAIHIPLVFMCNMHGAVTATPRHHALPTDVHTLRRQKDASRGFGDATDEKEEGIAH